MLYRNCHIIPDLYYKCNTRIDAKMIMGVVRWSLLWNYEVRWIKRDLHFHYSELFMQPDVQYLKLEALSSKHICTV